MPANVSLSYLMGYLKGILTIKFSLPSFGKYYALTQLHVSQSKDVNELQLRRHRVIL